MISFGTQKDTSYYQYKSKQYIQILIKLLTILLFLGVSCKNYKSYHFDGSNSNKILIYSNGKYKVKFSHRHYLKIFESHLTREEIRLLKFKKYRYKILEGYWRKNDSFYTLTSSIDHNFFKIVIDTIIYHKSTDKGLIVVNVYDIRHIPVTLRSIKSNMIKEISRNYRNNVCSIYGVYDPVYKINNINDSSGLYIESKSNNLYGYMTYVSKNGNLDDNRVDIKSDLFFLKSNFDSVEIKCSKCPCYPYHMSYFNNSKFRIVKDSLIDIRRY